MSPITVDQLTKYIEPNIRKFHQARMDRLSRLKLQDILLRKNPYLYRAKDIQTAEPFVRSILDAYLSSQEEGMFGTFLEGLAIYVCNLAYGGRKSAAAGIDLEFERDNVYYIVAIKSGPNWGNSQQIARMLDNFKKAKAVLRTNAPRRMIEAVNGCCYGREINEDKGDYRKLCGQAFWHFISGVDSLYADIIEPLGQQAHQPNQEFQQLYSSLVNKFTKELLDKFCESDGRLNWRRILEYNSARSLPQPMRG
ncbi:MAG: PmeII family type II restriction endonuclease [Thermoflexales bacterium]|nr:PmeII family type II restriction endonuclease [Thermoflexales bacterium]